MGSCVSFHFALQDLFLLVRTAGKKWSKEKLTARLEEGAGILKSVYRFVSAG